MTKIYLNYRRSTDGALAQAIASRLVQRFGSQNVFLDVSALNAGDNWLKQVESNLNACDVVLVIIGPDWLTAVDGGGRRRLDDPSDFVRFEIAHALKLHKTVIPVLVGGAQVPSLDSIPEDIRALSLYQAIAVRPETLQRDTEALISYLSGLARGGGIALPRRAVLAPIAAFLGLSVLFVLSLWGISQLPIRNIVYRLTQLVSNALTELYSSTSWRDGFLVGNSVLLLYLTFYSTRVTRVLTHTRSTSQASNRPQKHRVFICYRREDSSYATSYIYDKLEGLLGAGVIFKDVDSIPYGTDFRSHVKEKLTQCQVCLVVIGKSWLNMSDKEGNKRLLQESDPVRIEIETVLSRDMLVIPILVDNAPMPDSVDLPSSIEKLSSINGIQVRPHPDFQADVQRLASAIA
jgi:hypothetical protein